MSREYYMKNFPEKIEFKYGVVFVNPQKLEAICFLDGEKRHKFYMVSTSKTVMKKYITDNIAYYTKEKEEGAARLAVQEKIYLKFMANVKPGDIFLCSWGYEQTNIDFYEVTKKSKKCIFIRPIEKRKEEGGKQMDYYVSPLPGKYTGEEIRKLVQFYEYGILIRMEHGVLRAWDGKPVNETSYA